MRRWRQVVADLNAILILLLIIVYGVQMVGCWRVGGVAALSFPTPACLDHRVLLGSAVVPQVIGKKGR